MRNSYKVYIGLACIVIAGMLCVHYEDSRVPKMKAASTAEQSSEWRGIISKSINSKKIKLVVDGQTIASDTFSAYMDDELNLMVNLGVMTSAFSCATNYYESGKVVIEKFSTRFEMEVEKTILTVNNEVKELSHRVREVDDEVFIPLELIKDGLSYDYKWDVNSNTLTFTNQRADERIIPYYYDYRNIGKMPLIKNQSSFGTCWAFASLMAMETALAPSTFVDFSEDHMSLNNHFNVTQNDGGEYIMSMAYLASWTGPVLESDDPYGDGYSPEGLEPVYHVQEIQILESKNFDLIKKAIFLCGGVQSSFYVELDSEASSSEYYNPENSAYCYIGTEKPNHDIVIIGWDDSYPASNFGVEPDGDGAFICANSWGEEFGENGIFYISYYDSNIGVHNIVYTGIEEVDNYDNIYQSDLCGWVGQIGYNRDYAYFANVYVPENDESLEAVAFYATGANTDYKVYLVEKFETVSDFGKMKLLTEGHLTNAGYYTISIPESKILTAGERYAVVVYINTPNSSRPVAVEYRGDSTTAFADISDGEGYISLHGNIWQNVEAVQECNVCLKMFTNNLQK